LARFGAGLGFAFGCGCGAGVGAALGVAGAALAPRDTLALGRVAAGLARLRELAPLEKGAFLQALGDIAEEDGNVRLVEHELLRAIACALDSPMPLSIAALDPRLLRK